MQETTNYTNYRILPIYVLTAIIKVEIMKQIVPNDNCLTQEQILRYLRDETSPDENRAIDRHLSRCPMCSDAIEGAMMLDSKDLEKAFLQSKAYILEKTNEENLQKTALKVVRTPNRYLRYALSAAASLAVLVVAALWIFTKPLTESKEIIAEAPPQYNESKAADSAYFEQKPIVLEPQNPENNANTPSSYATEKPSTTKSENPIAASENNKIIDNQDIKSDDNLNMSTAAAPVPKKEAKEEVVATYSDNDGVSAKSKDREQEKAAVEYSAQERKLSKSKNAKSAAPTTTEGYTALPNVPAAAKSNRSESLQEMDNRVLNQGVKYFQEKEFDKAIGEFNSILTRQSSGDMYEKALWYSANAYYQMNSKPYSKAIYQRIVKEKGTFAAQAEVILKNWKE